MRIIDGHTRTCGLLGNPVEHTLSPLIHNQLADMTGANLKYLPFLVPQGQVGEAVKGAFALNLLGLNVTVPYKSQVIPFLREIDPLAARIGAVNTLVRLEDGYKGYNTDALGLYRAMCADGVGIAGEQVLILGAGGVARAVALLMAQKGAAEITLLNRTLDRAQAIAAAVNESQGATVARALPLEHYGDLSQERSLVIQTTSVGMHPHEGAAVIEDPFFYRKIHTGYDLVYNPARTRFMELVEEQGGRSFNGAKMLLYQGVIAYELWTGIAVSQEQADCVYRKMTEALGYGK